MIAGPHGIERGPRCPVNPPLFGLLKSSLILAAGAGGGIAAYRVSGESRADPQPASPRTASRATEGPGAVHALGSIQPRDGVVEVALPAGYRPTRLGEGIVQDGPVRKGQVIAYLEGYEARLRELEVVDAEIVAAEAALQVEDAHEKMTLAEIDREGEDAAELGAMEQASLKLKIDALDDKSRLCLKEVADVEGLQHNNTVPRQHYDQLAARAKISQEELDYARAEARRVASALRISTGPAKLERQRQKARMMTERARSQISIDALRKKRALGVEMIERSKVTSPIDGVVLDICTRAGESGAGKPLVKLGDTRRMYVLAEIYEDDRWRVRQGQRVEVRPRGLSGRGVEPIPGTLESIKPIIGAHKQSPLDPTSRDNARVFPAWVALDPQAEGGTGHAELEKLRQFVLLPVDVTILADASPPGGG